MLTELQKKDIKALKEECKVMEQNGYSAFDICCYINDIIYDLSETVSILFLFFLFFIFLLRALQ